MSLYTLSMTIHIAHLYSIENGLMDKHSYELDAMDLPFNHRYIPLDYPQPEDYWPEKFEDNTQE